MVTAQNKSQQQKISLHAITRDNWQEAIHLKVSPEQESYVTPNVESLAAAAVYRDAVPLAIYAGKEMVGFLMYEPMLHERTYWINRFMIDAQQQGKGYGRTALQEAIESLRGKADCDRILTSYEADNVAADHVYRNLGFEPTDKTDEKGRPIMALKTH